MNSEFNPNQESAFLIDSNQRQSDDASRMIGMTANDDEILKDFERSDSGKATETVCGCSGSCNCAFCNCLSDRAVESVDESRLERSDRSFAGKDWSDMIANDFSSLVENALQDNRTDSEGINFDDLRDRFGDEKGDFVEKLISQFQETDDVDAIPSLDTLDFNPREQKTFDS